MKIVLINDEGQSVASFDHVVRSDDRSPQQVFALLDVLEKLLENVARDSFQEAPGLPLAAEAGSPSSG